jgi:hypothetical protein
VLEPPPMSFDHGLNSNKFSSIPVIIEVDEEAYIPEEKQAKK